MTCHITVLPQAAGLLPKWQLFVSVVALFNTVQNFATLKFTRRVYSGKPHEGNLSQNAYVSCAETRLVPRIVVSSDPLAGPYLCRVDTSRERCSILRRLSHLRQTVRANPVLKPGNSAHEALRILSIYDIALISYLLAFGHFTSEFLIFGSVKLSAGSMSTFVVSSEYLLSFSDLPSRPLPVSSG